MSVARSAALALMIAASASLAPLPGFSFQAMAEGSRCSAYQPGSRTPERRQLLDALMAAINESPRQGTNFSLKRFWLSCNYARVVLRPRGRGEPLDALMIKVNGEWKLAMIASNDPAAGSPQSQYQARHNDIPEALIYW